MFYVVTHFNHTALRKVKIVYNFGLSECNRVKKQIRFDFKRDLKKQVKCTSAKFKERSRVVRAARYYAAESRFKVVSSRLGLAIRRLENSLCQPSSEWVPFSN